MAEKDGSEKLMTVQYPRDLDPNKLAFFRQLAQRGRIGRIPEGPPSGEALTLVIDTAKATARQTRLRRARA